MLGLHVTSETIQYLAIRHVGVPSRAFFVVFTKCAIARRVHWSLPKMKVFHLLMNFVVMLDSRPDYSPAANSAAVVTSHSI